MRTLPFIVKPKIKSFVEKIGNDEIGIIEIERRGFLNVAEKAFVDQVSQSADTVASTVALATKLSSKTKKTVEVCYGAIMEAVQGVSENKFAMKIKEEYPEEIGSIMAALIETASRRGLACANILLVSRVDPDWTIEDTMSQHPDMIEALAVFYNEEERGYKEEKEPEAKSSTEEEEEVAEIVGK
jgi:hypothetical protein